MKPITKLSLAALGAAGAWCALLCPRRGQPGWDRLAGVRYAHRGLHDPDRGIPENSMPAFRAAVQHGFGAELDVHLMADGNLAVVHDSNLSRVCAADVCVEDLTASELPGYPLMGTCETIPLLEDVLALFEHRTPLIIELKVERGNYNDLTDRTMKALQGWQGTCCIESFHPAALLRLRQKYPEVLRGQLSQNFLRDSKAANLSLPGRFLLTNLLTTGLTKPDFIAYRHQDRNNLSLRLMRRLYGVHEAGWTVQDERTLRALELEGVTPIFERFVP